MGELTPVPPWPVSAASNSKREGWRSFYAGVAREDCPYPRGRADLQRGFREGWDAALAASQEKA